MKPLHLSLSAFLVAVLPVTALAQTVISTQQFPFADISVGAYTDSPWDQPTNVAVSALTHMGVIRGNDDGSFAPDRRLNRAEFITIVMRLLSNHDPVSLSCFPDVSSNAWYAEDVCRAKSLGLVRGNVVAGVSSSEWLFEPTRDIQYEEAVKILVGLYALPLSGDTEGADWYVPYIRAAQNADVDLSGRVAGDHITRGEMARLTVAFVAESQGRLDELRNAERSSSSSSSSRSSSSSSRSSSKSSSSSHSSTSSSSSNTTVQSHILLLGTVSPAIAATDLFSNLEPVDVSAVTVTLAMHADSVGSLLIFDGSGVQIGTATAVSGSSTQFRASIAFGKLLLPYREERTISVKARLKSGTEGGVSGETVQVGSITVEGEGRWSSEAYTTTSTDTFIASQTALADVPDSGLAQFVNNGSTEGLFIPGQQKTVADFTVNATTPDAQHPFRVTDLTFTAEHGVGVTIANAILRNSDGSSSTPCTVSGYDIICSNIDPFIGTVDESRRIQLLVDVSVAPGTTNPYLHIVINDPGTPSAPGDVRWTDGTTSFTWIDADQPVFNGTMWR